MRSDLQLQNFRCFDSLALELAPGFNFFIAANGEGKTSILEAACVLLRLQSQRSASLTPLMKLDQKAFRVDGRWENHGLQFRYSGLRRNSIAWNSAALPTTCSSRMSFHLPIPIGWRADLRKRVGAISIF